MYKIVGPEGRGVAKGLLFGGGGGQLHQSAAGYRNVTLFFVI